MNLDYVILRMKVINNLNYVAQIGSHNKREKKTCNSNPDIKIELSKNNIELVLLAEKYLRGFDELTKKYKKNTRKE